ncbi:MAG: hypothetical protein L6R41_002456 [Letrouitia leprolyta]|nr:MAG: hypothetical protein L6R41_002456 [Letrouitia leprolyta]
MAREIAIEWLMNVTSKLNITPDEEVAKTNWGESRIAYDVWADWAVSAIRDWNENIVYGPGSGDQRGTAIDKPNDPQQLDRVKKAAKKLDKHIPAEPPLSVDKVPAESLFGDEEGESMMFNSQEARKILRQYFGSGKLAEEDASDGSWSEDESDSEYLFPVMKKDWKSRILWKPIQKIDFKKSSNKSPYQKSKEAKAEKNNKKKKSPKDLKG